MTTLEILQIIGACLALLLQLAATILTKPIRRLLPLKLWWFVFSLNLLELVRRVMILFSVTSLLSHSSYDFVTVIMGLMISTALLLLMRELSHPSKKVQKQITHLARETVHKIAKAEDSLAYRLAAHFIETREHQPSEQQ